MSFVTPLRGAGNADYLKPAGTSAVALIETGQSRLGFIGVHATNESGTTATLTVEHYVQAEDATRMMWKAVSIAQSATEQKTFPIAIPLLAGDEIRITASAGGALAVYGLYEEQGAGQT